MEEKKTYYLYRHIRKDKNIPFYIGIGTIYTKRCLTPKSLYARAYEKKKSRNIYWKNIINKTDYVIQIIFETTDIALIQQKEKYFINLYGMKKTGGQLCNLTTGGMGLEGFSHTTETKKRIAECNKQRIYKKGYTLQMSEEGRNNLRNAVKNRIVSEETRKKMSNGMKNNFKGKRSYSTVSGASISTVPLSNCADS